MSAFFVAAAPNGGQAGVRLRAGVGTTYRATRIDFYQTPVSTTIPRWTLINDYDQNNTNDLRLFSGLYGNPVQTWKGDGTTSVYNTLGVGNAAGSTSGAGITFPATQNASSNANTLDDYEEGTFATNAYAVLNCSSISVSSAVYVKVGRQVTCEITGTFTVTSSGTNTYFVFDVPFAAQLSTGGAPGQGVYGSSTNNIGIVLDNSGATDYQYGFWVQSVNNTESGSNKPFQLGLTYIAAA